MISSSCLNYILFYERCQNLLYIICICFGLLFSRNRPTEAVIGEKSGPGPHCPRCLRTVYDAERAIGLNDVSKN